ncbi:uncharacterized protein LOC120005356 [Tripterygium wilfordii]|uniref:uncharacterized protein LOC120005356 n=1 Tax=Tripterygium wilfordii TaxID=458696 RepID=UPI0018F7EB1A|nr:uncharacterized protein LOC120005356 [Tripterygium wilfordii]
MKLLLWRWCPLSSSRIKSGRNWVCKTSPRNIIRKRSKRFLNTRQSKLKVTKEKPSAKKKKAKTPRMMKWLNNWKAKLEELKPECARLREENKLAIEEKDKLEEMESECARVREEHKLAIEKNLQLKSEYVLLFTLLFGGDGGI